MPLPTPAELTDPNAKNSDMKQRLVQIVETLHDHENKSQFSLVNTFQAKRMAITGDFMDLGVVDPDAEVINLTDAGLINKSISYGENGTNIKQLTQNKSCLYPTGLKVDSAIAKITLDINVNSLQPYGEMYVGGIGVAFGQTALYWHNQGLSGRIAKKVGTDTGTTRVSAESFTTGNLKIETIIKSDHSVEITFTQGVNSYSISDTVDGLELSLFVYAGIDIDVKATYESISNITNDAIKELDILQPGSYITSEKLIGVYINSDDWTVTTNPSSSAYATFKVLLEPNQRLKIQTTNGNRLRAGVSNSLHSSYDSAFALDKVVFNDDTKSSFEFENDADGKELYVYAAITNISAVTMNAELAVYRTKKPILAAGLVDPISTANISDYSVTAEKTDFLKSDSVQLSGVLRRDIAVGYDPVDTNRPVWLLGASTSWSYEYDIQDNELIIISAPAAGHNRLRIIALASNRDDGIKFTDEISEVVYLGDDTGILGGTYSFNNTVGATKLLITVNTGSQTIIDVVPTVTKTVRRIDGLVINNKGNVKFSRKFNLIFDKIPDSTKLNLVDPKYPSLACVNYEHIDNDYPIAKGFLYVTQGETQEFLYSAGRPDNMVKVANWNPSITYGGNRKALHYSPFITNDGDILCIYNGSYISGTEVNPNARQNPIIYPANDYDNPVVIDFGSAIKPTAWLMDVGVVQIPNSDKIVFCEYTRPVHEKARIWTVTKPYTDPNNWNIVQEFLIDRPGSNSAEGNLKHIHMIKRDPWSGMLVCGVGDYEMGAKILTSKDDGDTWVIEGEGDESRYRVTQMHFTEDGAWWGSDSHVSKHIFWKANRDAQGYPVFGINEIELVTRFPTTATGSAATYGAVLMRDPNGILFLDRQDNSTTPDLLKIYFWSFDDSKLHLTGTIDRVGATGARGFRFTAQETHQSPTRDYVMVGFNDVHNGSLNHNAVAGNSESNRIYNLAIRLIQNIEVTDADN